nr:hypothetical protein CFP56_13353 [Quercus suber]
MDTLPFFHPLVLSSSMKILAGYTVTEDVRIRSIITYHRAFLSPMCLPPSSFTVARRDNLANVLSHAVATFPFLLQLHLPLVSASFSLVFVPLLLSLPALVSSDVSSPPHRLDDYRRPRHRPGAP